MRKEMTVRQDVPRCEVLAGFLDVFLDVKRMLSENLVAMQREGSSFSSDPAKR